MLIDKLSFKDRAVYITLGLASVAAGFEALVAASEVKSLHTDLHN